MRKFNFDIRFMPRGPEEPTLRVFLNWRFASEEMLSDFPKNMLDGYAGVRLGGVHYCAQSDNAIAIRFEGEVTDTDRAILLNLIDFGQDHEAGKSITIDRVEFYVEDPSTLDVETLMTALAQSNANAVERMSALMMDYVLIEDEEFDRPDWPGDLFWRYFYTVMMEFEPEVSEAVATQIANNMEALNAACAWLAFNADMTPAEAAQSGLSGISYEIACLPDEFQYIVERPASNPALPVVFLLDWLHKHNVQFDLQINVTEEA